MSRTFSLEIFVAFLGTLQPMVGARACVGFCALLSSAGCHLVSVGAGEEFACHAAKDCVAGTSCCADGICRASCPGVPTPPVPDSGPGTDPCTLFASLACGQYENCSYGGYVVTVRYGDVPTCVTRLSLLCSDYLHVDGSGLTESELAACLPSVASLNCAAFFVGNGTGAALAAILAGCRGSSGFVPNESACSEGAQCQSGLCSGSGICGICTEPAGLGNRCSSTPCEYPQVCLTTTKTCALPQPDGGACTSEDDCILGLGCADGGKGALGYCAPGQVGTPCDPYSNGPCPGRLGLQCWLGPDAGFTCVPYGLADAGQLCSEIPGVYTYTTCAMSGTCVDLDGGARVPGHEGYCVGFARDGDHCDSTYGPACMEPASCESGTCVLPYSDSCGVALDGG